MSLLFLCVVVINHKEFWLTSGPQGGTGLWFLMGAGWTDCTGREGGALIVQRRGGGCVGKQLVVCVCNQGERTGRLSTDLVPTDSHWPVEEKLIHCYVVGEGNSQLTLKSERLETRAKPLETMRSRKGRLPVCRHSTEERLTSVARESTLWVV